MTSITAIHVLDLRCTVAFLLGLVKKTTFIGSGKQCGLGDNQRVLITNLRYIMFVMYMRS